MAMPNGEVRYGSCPQDDPAEVRETVFKAEEAGDMRSQEEQELLIRRDASRVFSWTGSSRDTIQWYAPPARRYTRRELLVDRGVNFFGAGMSIVVGPLLTFLSWRAGDSLAKVFGYVAFGMGLIAMFGLSANYHYRCWDWSLKTLRPLDHIGINLMIMGTYTPPTQHCQMYYVLLFVWVLGLGGVSLEVWRMTCGRTPRGSDDTKMWIDYVNIARYLLMGWAILMAVPVAIHVFPVHQLLTMLAGGLLFTFGVPFFLLERIEFHLAVWHIFVLLASSCFIAIAAQLVGKAPVGL